MYIASQGSSAGLYAANWYDPAMVTILDTHAAIKRLTAAGITTSHAEAIVETVSQAEDQLVTKADLHAALASLERRLIGYLIAAVLIVPGAVKYL